MDRGQKCVSLYTCRGHPHLHPQLAGTVPLLHAQPKGIRTSTHECTFVSEVNSDVPVEMMIDGGACHTAEPGFRAP